MPGKLLPLLGGSYEARNFIANAQRCVNLYPEHNPKDSPVPVTHYLTPGLTLLIPGPVQAAVRGYYLATNGQLFAVIGSGVYYVDVNWQLHLLGNIGTVAGPVSMVDNNATLVLVDGSPNGYTINLVSHAFAAISDAAFFGADHVQYLDTFTLFNDPDTQGFYSTLSNQITPFDPLYFANKTGFADPLIGIRVIHREIWLFGRQTTEVWYNAGGPLFPFAIQQGVFIQQGCAAKHSIASWNLTLFWLSQDNNGQAIVMEGVAYQAKPISTPAIVKEISTYPVISDAIGFVYQQQGHVFYQLTFPTADKTWVYDLTTQSWHQRTWIDANGQEHRHRANCAAFAYGKTIVGDWQNGATYIYDLDSANDNGQPIIRRRGFPHLMNAGAKARHNRFSADVACGTTTNPAADPQLFLRWSDARGREGTFQEPVAQSMGKIGETDNWPTWPGLGVARDRVYELFWSEDIPNTALNGAYVDVTPLSN